jgi:hypothetical protein
MNFLKRSTHSGRSAEDASSIPKRIVITKLETLTARPTPPSKITQPIPIKQDKNHRESYEPDNEANAAKYDLATWNMYVLITNARRMRALSSISGSTTCTSSTESSVNEKPPVPQVYTIEGYDEAVSPDLDDSSSDDCYDDIFELDYE